MNKTIQDIPQGKFKEIFEEFFPSMCVYAQGFLNDFEKAKDAVHDSFLKIWESDYKYTTHYELKKYLYSSVRNKCIDFIRRENLQNKYNENYKVIEDVFSTEFYKNAVIKEEVYSHLTKAISTLPPQSRKILELNLQGLRNKEIAQELNISINTLKTLKLSAYKTIRNLLKDKYIIACILFFENFSEKK